MDAPVLRVTVLRRYDVAMASAAPLVWVAVVLGAPPIHARAPVASQTPVLVEAAARAAEFDLVGAAALLEGSSGTGDAAAWVPAVYVRGLINALDASREGGTPKSLEPVREAIAWLELTAGGRAGPAEIARLMLHAAAAAAQSERDEMRLYLDTALHMETLQRSAGLAGAPIITAAETAGDLWLHVHRYDQAQLAYERAAEQSGVTLRILAGRGRAARGANSPAVACAAFRALIEDWGVRRAEPVEIAEARSYVAASCERQ